MKLFKIISIVVLALLLTLLTQVGGIILLMSLVSYRYNKKFKNAWVRFFVKFSTFLILYFISVFTLVPYFAELSGRVQLPIFEKNHLRPATILTCLLNRNYVRPELRNVAFRVAENMNQNFPGTTVNYLDANFPFINKFPLFPHLSHNDGKKLDLSFQYNDAKGRPTNEIPSFIGYGICEEPQTNEENIAALCASQGYWQYGLLKRVISQSSKTKFQFDQQRTKALVDNFSSEENIGRIFIEPHLKRRLGLKSSKIVFHGCHAVRHDDHLHVQLR